MVVLVLVLVLLAQQANLPMEQETLIPTQPELQTKLRVQAAPMLICRLTMLFATL
jgi:hypothetical protein